MYDFIVLFIDFILDILSLFDKVAFQYGSITVTYSAIIFACIVIGFVVNIFWKGAKA